MNPSRPPDPLHGDPARQAPDLHKGVVYQIWRSVEAWLQLRDDELLFLEGAEDFDVVSDNNGTAVQVKATQANVTLRSEAIITALNSYWLIRQNHPGMKITLRFISTSEVGTEQGDPFGIGTKGLETWKACALNSDEALALLIRNFLRADASVLPHLSPALVTFLQTATPTDIVLHLVGPVSWETGGGDSDVVKESVAMFLRAYGERFGVLPTESVKVSDHLFRIAAEAAAKKDGRTLSKDDFRQQFEKTSCEVVPRAQLMLMRAQANQLQQFLSTTVTQTPGLLLVPVSLIKTGVPELPPTVIRRNTLVETICECTRDKGVTVVSASSGMGKSTLAKLAAPQIPGNWLWIDFQGLPVEHIAQIVRAFGSTLLSLSRGTNLALDNLDFSGADLLRADNTLASLAQAVTARNGCVIITTQQELPVRLLQKLRVDERRVIRVTPLTQEDIEQFCTVLGCTDQDLAMLWAKIVRLQTSGHPQLVHARLVSLSNASWPRPSPNDLLDQPAELLQEMDLARRILDEAPSADKEMLYRLSLLTWPFRRDQAVAIAQHGTENVYAGDTFGRLVGPWIEPLSGEYFRLSPLLSKAATRNWPADKIRELRSVIARAILSCGNKTLLEASEVLFQALAAEDEKAVGAVAAGLVLSPVDANGKIAEFLYWLPLIGSKSGKKAFAKNAHLNFLVRIIQFRIVAERNPEDLDNLCAIIDDECRDFTAEEYLSTRLMWLTTVLTLVQARVNPSRFVNYWSEAYDLLQKEPALGKMARDAEATIQSTDLPNLDLLGHFLMVLLVREMDVEFLVQLFNALDNLQEPQRNAAISRLKQLLFPLRLAIDRSWSHGTASSGNDWDNTIGRLRSVEQFAGKWEIPQLRTFIARGIAAIEDEYRHDPARALEELDACADTPTSHSFLIADQKALVLFRQKRFTEAIEIWQETIPNWPVRSQSPDLLPVLACQRAGTAAGAAGQWDNAATFFEHGRVIAEKLGYELFQITFKADFAFARWKSGKKDEGLEALAVVLEKLEACDTTDEDDFQFHRAWKYIEQVIKWCKVDAGVPSPVETYEPPAGCCSQPEANERLRDIPRAPLDITWLFLAEAETQMGIRRGVFERAVARIPKSQVAAFRSAMAWLALTVAFQRLELENVILHAVTFVNSTAYAMALVKAGHLPLAPDVQIRVPPGDPSIFVQESLASALIALAAADQPLESYMERWEASVNRLSNPEPLRASLRQIRCVLAADMREAHDIYHSSERTCLERLVAAVRMGSDTDGRLEAMFLGHASLIGALSKSELKDKIAKAVGSLVKRRWENRLAFPIEFLTPRLTIPAIRSACAENVTGFRLGARILLQARFAVPLIVPGEVLRQFESF